ncbi:MAG: RNA-guided pseudouridylation complex pseudouridine synthase subunit Cbf5 [Nanoarchaeota archaeon]|nr:RNA-guided pseudouridylation complex pseudouridine synthase subunit Cbf5 [Nanoarchaeota archaeon]
MKTKITDLINFGLINIDKSRGPTSYSISEYVRRQLKLKKTSHMGTLDPMVTGVLPITLGRACKLANYFIRHDKTYVGVMHTHNEADMKDLQKLIDKNFLGKIKQTPPRKSAVKIQERERTVYSFKFLEASVDSRDFLFECKVEGGTYIRKICSDLGGMIGGAHMNELRRTEAGIFSEEDLYTLEEFDISVDSWKEGNDKKLRKMIIPAKSAIKQVLPYVEIDKSAVKSLYQGKPLFRSNVIKGANELKEGEVFAAFCKEVFIGIYKKGSEEIIFARSEFVYN